MLDDGYLSAQLKKYIDEKFTQADLMSGENLRKEAKLRNKKQNSFWFYPRFRALTLSLALVTSLSLLLIFYCHPCNYAGMCNLIDTADTHTSTSELNSNTTSMTGIFDKKDIEFINNPKVNPDQQPGAFTAGQWNDNLNWPFFTNLIANRGFEKYLDYWGLDPTTRIAATITSGGKPVEAAKLHLTDTQDNIIWTSVTDNQGNAYLFYNLYKNLADQSLKLVVNSGNSSKTVYLSPGQKEVSVEISNPQVLPKALDLMLVIDTTSSMGPELGYLQNEINNIITRVENKHQDIDIRISYILYRDEGDEYVVRSHPFVSGPEQVTAANNFLGHQKADGGGDYPEAIDKALEEAIYNQDWSADSTAKLLFLVHDAPAHSDDESINKLHKLIQDTSAKGVRIIPIASRGVDSSTEFLMRSLAIASGGTYVFLTDYGAAVLPHHQPSVGEFEIEHLNDLMVDIIDSYLK